jgi:hypothetical protein
MIEAVQYQRTLAWLMRQAMEDQSVWYVIDEFIDQRGKYNKIVDGLNGIASAGHLWVKNTQTEFISQFTDYPNVSHDDVIETVAIGVTELHNPEHLGGDRDESGFSGDIMDESHIPDLKLQLGAP